MRAWNRFVCSAALAASLILLTAVAALAAPSSSLTSTPSTGCSSPAPQKAGTSRTYTLSVAGVNRTYVLHLPTGYRVGKPIPLVLVFHGHGTNAATFEWTTGFSRQANHSDFVAVYPQGLKGPDGQVGWNTGRASDTSANDVGFVDALVEHLTSTLCINANRIYATGFSNGGGFVSLLACDRSYLFTAFAVVSGDYVPQTISCAAQRPVPVLEIHGTGDQINPYAGSASKDEAPATVWLGAWVARDSCDVSSPTVKVMRHGVTFFAWKSCAPGSVVEHYQLARVGHVWPNGSRSTDYFSATSAIWTFFSQHS